MRRRTVHLPVECWGEILEKAIFVPLFFDTDPLENYPASIIRRYKDQGPYWESERTRNALRRVCSSWNSFLKQFDHRYIQAGHVESGSAPPEALRRATRVDTMRCTCRSCHKSSRQRRQKPHGDHPPWSSIVAAADDNGAQGPWRMQILQIYQPGYAEEIIKKLPSQCKNLKVIAYHEAFSSSDILPQLIGLNFIIHPHLAVLTTLPTLPDVTTLYLPAVIQITGLENLHLPRLRHLSIDGDPNHSDPRPLLEWLRATGSRLITLFWAGRTSDGDFLAELWDLCPHIRRLQLPMGTKWTPPPPGRSLELLRLASTGDDEQNIQDAVCSICGHVHPPHFFQFMACIPQLALDSVSCVAILVSWKLLFENGTPRRSLVAAHCMALHAASYSILMLDEFGYTFEDAVVSWLEQQLTGHEEKYPQCFFF